MQTIFQNGNILEKQKSTTEIGHPDITIANIQDLKLSNWTKKIGTQVADLSIWDEVFTIEEMVSWTTCRWDKNVSIITGFQEKKLSTIFQKLPEW